MVINLVGCSAKQEPKVIYKYIPKYVYLECKKPEVPEKPKFVKYKIMRIKFEDKYYYCVDVDNAKIIAENWLKYKNWCENLQLLLSK